MYRSTQASRGVNRWGSESSTALSISLCQRMACGCNVPSKRVTYMDSWTQHTVCVLHLRDRVCAGDPFGHHRPAVLPQDHHAAPPRARRRWEGRSPTQLKVAGRRWGRRCLVRRVSHSRLWLLHGKMPACWEAAHRPLTESPRRHRFAQRAALPSARDPAGPTGRSVHLELGLGGACRESSVQVQEPRGRTTFQQKMLVTVRCVAIRACSEVASVRCMVVAVWQGSQPTTGDGTLLGYDPNRLDVSGTPTYN